MMYRSEIPVREKVIQEILDKKVIAVVHAANGDQAVKITRALSEGGITVVALAFDLNNPDSHNSIAKAIRAISRELKDQVLIGAANITSQELLYKGMNDMAQFIVSPDADAEIIKKTRQMAMASIPAAATPTEAKLAYAAGADFVTLFPCMGDSADYLKKIQAPLSNINFLATVSADNAAKMIQAGAVGVCVDDLVDQAWVEAGEYSRITDAAKNFVAAIG